MSGSARIQAAVVNHNTSAFTELMLRSLFATHSTLDRLELAIRVFDNASTEDSASLRAFAAQKNIPVLPSGFSLNTVYNSHGEILRNFVLANPDCEYYLFLDADVVFIQPETIPAMLAELESTPNAYGAGPLLSWDGEQPLPESVVTHNPDIYQDRLHPCCALVKNTHLFQSIVEEVGLFCVKFLWAEQEEYIDTFKLMTKVMKTHGLRHIITPQMVMHFFTVSYDWDPEDVKRSKIARRDELLNALRGSSAQ